jgi:drug/metabolite transporter (DMT)-like permease
VARIFPRTDAALLGLRSWLETPTRVCVAAEVALGLAGVIWGANFVLVKFAVERMGPFYYLGLRFLVATVILAPFCVGRLRRLSRRGWLVGTGVGVLLFAGFALQTVGLKTISPGRSGFLPSLYVIVVPLILVLFTRRWPSPSWLWVWWSWWPAWPCFSIYGSFGFGWGEILTLLATVFWALHILGVSYGSSRISTIAFVELQMATVAVLSLITAFAFERPCCSRAGRQPAPCYGPG